MHTFFIVVFFLSFQAFAINQRLPKFNYIGSSSKEQFQDTYTRASKRLSLFYSNHKLDNNTDSTHLIEKVEIYSNKNTFDKKLIQLSQGKMTSVPKTFVGLSDKKILRVVSWPVYKEIHPNDSLEDYEKVLTHEIAHQLHVRLLNGKESLMGPIWFFEGFAVLAANQYEDFEVNDSDKIEVVLNPERGNYKSYGSVMRKLVKLKPLSELIKMTKDPKFNSKVIELLK